MTLLVKALLITAFAAGGCVGWCWALIWAYGWPNDERGEIDLTPRAKE
jgi:hypothetical protein